jgi:hypothetical protein
MKTRAKHEAEAEALIEETSKKAKDADAMIAAFLMATQGKIVDILLDIHEMLDNRLPNNQEGKP